MQGMLRGEVEDLGVFADHKESRGFWKGAEYKVRSWDNLFSFPMQHGEIVSGVTL